MPEPIDNGGDTILQGTSSLEWIIAETSGSCRSGMGSMVTGRPGVSPHPERQAALDHQMPFPPANDTVDKFNRLILCVESEGGFAISLWPWLITAPGCGRQREACAPAPTRGTMMAILNPPVVGCYDRPVTDLTDRTMRPCSPT
jgi:hypothetical protein